MEIASTFQKAAGTVEATLDLVGDDDFAAPGLGGWSVAELIAHLVRAADRISTYAELPLSGDGPTCDSVSYFHFDFSDELSQAVEERSRQDAQRIGTDALVETFARSWRRSLEVLDEVEPTHLIETIRGPMAIADYAATRVLELVVHHLDLRRALGLPLTSDPAALQLTEELLDGLLDGERPPGMDGHAWLLAATGREPHDDPRLPVLR